ncbi:MAG: phosphoribosylformylglycinamidine synthase subunit PurQ, partial [Synergistaceae bacterium]|nr:phosphoribosylformylglycinamidine synthase subunit PurQ [Synergistaceae bacterium]
KIITNSELRIPNFLIPVFTGTNCEYETAKAISKAGGKAKIFVVRSLTPELMKTSAEEFARELKSSQALVLPGGFSNGDEPDGSGKFIAIFLRSPVVREALEDLINKRGGLVAGICNGFQALVKTGLLPYGKICEPDELKATLTFNKIGRHQSRIIFSRVVNNFSAWLRKTKVGEVYSMPISHGEGRFSCSPEIFEKLMTAGQIAGQYVNLEGSPSMETQYNPSGSFGAVECLTSPDGRILGRMGHVERVGRDLYKNVPGNYEMKFFESAVEFLKNN